MQHTNKSEKDQNSKNPKSFLDPAVLAQHIRAAQKDPDTAFGTLYLYAWSHVYEMVRNLLRNDTDVADVTQEVFLTIFRKISTITKPEAGLAWIDRITVNAVHDACRKNRLQEDTASLDDLSADSADSNRGELLGAWDADQLSLSPRSDDKESIPGWRMEIEERDSIVYDLVRGLPQKLAETLMLRYWGEYRNHEIAELLGESESVIATRLSRGRKELQARLMSFADAHDSARFWAASFGLSGALQRASACAVPVAPKISAASWSLAAHAAGATAAATVASALSTGGASASASGAGAGAASASVGASASASVAATASATTSASASAAATGASAGAAGGSHLAWIMGLSGAVKAAVVGGAVLASAASVGATILVTRPAAPAAPAKPAPVAVVKQSGADTARLSLRTPRPSVAHEATAVAATDKKQKPAAVPASAANANADAPAATPQITLSRAQVSYPAGTLLTGARLKADSGAHATSATGNPLAVTFTGLAGIDTATPGVYVAFVHATDAGRGTSASCLLEVVIT